jgi:hypothetical protein
MSTLTRVLLRSAGVLSILCAPVGAPAGHTHGPVPAPDGLAGVRAQTPPSARFETANVYNTPIAQESLHPDRTKIAIGVHGWTSDPGVWWRDGNNSWNMPGLRSAMVTALGDSAAQWDLWGLDWREGAHSAPVSPSTATEVNAQLQGQYIANVVAEGNYTHVHLMGHSLGGRVIETATTLIRQVKPEATVHATFFDAYTPHKWSRVYGSRATFAEHYYTDLDDLSGSLTAGVFPHALNINMNAHVQPRPDDWDFDPNDNNNPNMPNFIDNEFWRHNSPHFFYKRTAQDPAAAQWGGYGYAVSRESGADPWPPAGPAFARRQNVVLGADGAATRTEIQGVIEHPQNAVTRPITPGSVTGSNNATISEAMNRVTLDAFSAAEQQMAYANLSLTITQPINFFEFDYEWLALSAGEGRVTFSVLVPGAGFFPAMERLLWASDSEVGFERRLSTGLLMVTSNNPLPAGTYDLRFRLDFLMGESTSVRISNIRAGLLDVPAPTAAVLPAIALAMLLARRRSSARFTRR